MHTVQAAAKVGSRGPDSPASAARRKPTGLFTRAPTALCHCHSTSNLHLAAALTRPSAPWSLPPGASATRWTTCATAKAGPVSLKAEDICLLPAMGGHRTNERPSPWPTVPPRNAPTGELFFTHKEDAAILGTNKGASAAIAAQHGAPARAQFDGLIRDRARMCSDRRPFVLS